MTRPGARAQAVLGVAMAATAFMIVSCGPRAFVSLEVRSTLRIPSEVDSLAVFVRDATGELLSDEVFVLTAGDPFPVTVVYEPQGGTPRSIRFVVRGILDGSVVAETAPVEMTWADDAYWELCLDLDDPAQPEC